MTILSGVLLQLQLVTAVAAAPGTVSSAFPPVDVAIPPVVEWPHVEPHIAVDPQDPDHVMIAAIAVDLTEPASRVEGREGLRTDCATYVTHDGGRTWEGHLLGLSECGDPWLVAPEDGGRFFMSVVGISAGSPVRLFESPRGGGGWTEVGRLPRDVYDRPSIVSDTSGIWMVASQTGGIFDPSGKMALARFSGGDVDFELVEPVAGAIDADSPIMAGGRLVVPFTARGTYSVLVAPPSFPIEYRVARVTDRCAATDNAIAIDAIDDEHLYVACTYEDRSRVLVLASADGGTTWTEIGAPAPARPAIAVSAPSIAAGPGHAVAVTWYETLGTPESRCYRYVVSRSEDGARSFGPPSPSSNRPSCADAEINGWAAGRWPLGTDYGATHIDARGVLHTVWVDARTGRQRLTYTKR